MRPSNNVLFIGQNGSKPFTVTLQPNQNVYVLVTKTTDPSSIIIEGQYNGGKLAKNDKIIWRRPRNDGSGLYYSQTYYCVQNQDYFQTTSGTGSLPWTSRDLQPDDEIYYYHVSLATTPCTVTFPATTKPGGI